jgi:hypothetical protein
VPDGTVILSATKDLKPRSLRSFADFAAQDDMGLASNLPLQVLVKERMLRLEMLRMRPDEIATALDLSLSDIISWLAGETNCEQADIVEVGLSLLEMRPRRTRQDEPTLRFEALVV